MKRCTTMATVLLMFATLVAVAVTTFVFELELFGFGFGFGFGLGLGLVLGFGSSSRCVKSMNILGPVRSVMGRVSLTRRIIY